MKKNLLILTALLVTAIGFISCSSDKPEHEIEVTGVTLNQSTLILSEGDSQNLTATILPDNADNKQLTWTCNNNNVATVDNNGKVTALQEGSATITVSSHNYKTATCKLTVIATAVVPVTEVYLNITELELAEGGSETLTATITPSNATNKAVSWSSNQPTIANVDANGNITAIAEGAATITVTTDDGNKTATCEVSIIALTEIASGTAGNLTWVLMNNGVLTISGTGAMPNYGGYDTPWYPYRNATKTVVIANGVTHIGSFAFYLYDCPGFTSITLPNSLISIEQNAFRGNNFTSITIPNSVTSIGYSVFYACNSLQSIDVESGNPNYVSENGILFNKAKTTLIRYPSAKQGSSYTIPNSVAIIDWEAFQGCRGLQSIDIPSSVISIGQQAFEDCRELTEMTVKATIPPAVDNSGSFAFVNRSIPVYVPQASLQAYKDANIWEEFTNLQGI